MKQGINRVVFLIGNYAIKLPNVLYSHSHFLQGCYANWKERIYYKIHSKANYKDNMSHSVAPSLFCSWFGLIQIQIRCKPLNRDLTKNEKKYFYPLCGRDNKKENFGILNGRIVCLDYQ